MEAAINPTPVVDHEVVDLRSRIRRVEEHVGELKERDHRTVTELALMQKDITYIKGTQDKVASGINKILWAIGLSVITGFTTFVMTGGLTLAQQ